MHVKDIYCCIVSKDYTDIATCIIYDAEYDVKLKLGAVRVYIE